MRYRKLTRILLAPYPEVIWRKASDQNNLFLTFDDGPDPEITPQVLQILKKYRIPAVFFLQGEKLAQGKKELKHLRYQGHSLGNHGYSHHPLLLKSPKSINDGIRETDRLIYREFGQKTTLFRPPYGIWGPALRRQLRLFDKQIVLWSLMAFDFKWETEKVRSHLLKYLSPGDIIVFHDNSRSGQVLLKILPEFIEQCLQGGYTFHLV